MQFLKKNQALGRSCFSFLNLLAILFYFLGTAVPQSHGPSFLPIELETRLQLTTVKQLRDTAKESSSRHLLEQSEANVLFIPEFPHQASVNLELPLTMVTISGNEDSKGELEMRGMDKKISLD